MEVGGSAAVGSAALAELGVPRGAMAGAVGSAALAEAGAPRGATAEPAGAAALTVAGSGCERPDAARPYVPSLWYACLHCDGLWGPGDEEAFQRPAGWLWEVMRSARSLSPVAIAGHSGPRASVVLDALAPAAPAPRSEVPAPGRRACSGLPAALGGAAAANPASCVMRPAELGGAAAARGREDLRRATEA